MKRYSLAGLIIILSLILLATCQGPFELRTVLGLDTEVLSVSPNAASIADNVTQLFTVSGGTAPYIWSIYAGPGSIDAAGLYTPGVIGVATIQVIDTAGLSGKATIKIITPATIPDVDYQPMTVIATAPTEIGGAITADFMYENIGNDNGSSDVSWSAYISTSTDLSGVVSLANSGTVPALSARTASGSSQDIGGFWPPDGGEYYIVVHLAAEADVDIDNNVDNSGKIVISVDYHQTALPPTFPVLAGSPLSVDFGLSNQGTVDGASNVIWYAYISTNGVVGVGDTLIDDGNFPGLNRDDTQPETVTVEGNWPSVPGNYHVLLEWVSADDPAGYKATASGTFNVSL